jgi:hypothetical protein
MSPDSQNPIVQPTTPSASETPVSNPVTVPGSEPAPATRKPKGKIASLTKAQRDTINSLLHDGATYAQVAELMADQGVSLNAENLSNWFQTGFQDYLAELERLQYQRQWYEAAKDMLKDTDTATLPEAGLQTAAAQIYDLLGRFTPAVLAQKMIADPDKYTRLLNALFRLARETLALQKNRDARRGQVALETKDAKRKLTDSERRAIVRNVDEIFGINPDGDDEPSASESSSSSSSSSTPQPPTSLSDNGHTDSPNNGSTVSA